MPKKVASRSRKNKKVASRSRKNKKVASRSRKMIKGGTPPKASNKLLKNMETLPDELTAKMRDIYLSGLRQRAQAHRENPQELSEMDSKRYKAEYFYEIPLTYATKHDGITEITYVPVEVVPGVNKFKSVMKENGIIYAYELIGQFLVFKKNKNEFKEWLKVMIKETFELRNFRQAIDNCVSSVSQYVENIERDLNLLPKNFISPNLVQNGINEPYELVGQFWCFKRNEKMFKTWLNSMIETPDESIRITSEIKTFMT
jgi:hypothetical protein